MPFNLSETLGDFINQSGDYCHNYSYLYLHELKDALEFLRSKNIKVEGMKDKSELVTLRKSIATGSPDWDLLFPFCASTNIQGYETFSLDVPATFKFGECLKRIIDSFEGIDGDNHRLVFFFDN